jgi:hypothetical protein
MSCFEINFRFFRSGVLSFRKSMCCLHQQSQLSMMRTISLLNGGDSYTTNFGKINYYDTVEFALFFEIRKLMGICTFYALQYNEVKSDPDWQNKMLELEFKVLEISKFINVYFFQPCFT